MCARFVLFTPPEMLAVRFSLPQVPALTPRYNVAPSQEIPVVGAKANGQGRGLAMFRWGLIPSWSADASGPKPVNAKSETVAELPSFRDSFRRRRCLIPADGFYEWVTTPTGKQPLYHRFLDGRTIAFAGIWDVWNNGTEKRFTCALLTTTANELVAQVHDRMPVILPESDWDTWLDADLTDPTRLKPLLKPHPAEGMAITPVDRRVNNARVEGPECLTPVVA